MKIVITGGCGFIGSAIVRKFVTMGYQVLNFDKLTYAGHKENVKDIEELPNYEFALADIRDIATIKEYFDYFMPDAVIHLAAESHVDRSIADPSDFISTNVMGTLNMLEVSRSHWKRNGLGNTFRFLHVSTDEVFGSLPLDSTFKFSEDTRYEPRSPYSASKASSDHLVRAWYKTYGFPSIVANCSNNFGPYQYPEKLIPLVIIKALSWQPIPIYGDGMNVRDWLFVDDHVLALLNLLNKGEPGRDYNIGGGNELTNLELVTLICQMLDQKRPNSARSYKDLINFIEDRPGHDARYSVSTDRIKSEIGWKPKTAFKKGLEETLDWYITNESWWQSILKKANDRSLSKQS